MMELLVFAAAYAFLAAISLYRLAKGPSAADRMVAGDSMDVLVCSVIWKERGCANENRN